MARRVKLKWGISPDSKELRPHMPEGRKRQKRKSGPTFDIHQIMLNPNYRRIRSHSKIRQMEFDRMQRHILIHKQRMTFALICVAGVVAMMVTAVVLMVVL